MPPPKKANAPPPEPVIVEIKDFVDLSVRLTKSNNELSTNKVKVRLFSEWLDCCGTSGIFGEDDLAWSINENFDFSSVVFKSKIDVSFEGDDKINLFNYN
jgi:hypothetical protein